MNNDLIIVFYGYKSQENITKGLIESARLNLKYNFKLVYFTVDFSTEIKYDNLVNFRISEKELNYFIDPKSIIIEKSINIFGNRNYLYLDNDILFSKKINIDNIINNYNYPMSSSLEYSKSKIDIDNYTNDVVGYLYKNIKKIDDINIEEIISNLNVKNLSMGYQSTKLISYNSSCLDFIKEWKKLLNNTVNKPYSFNISDLFFNLLLWKKGADKSFKKILFNAKSYDIIEYIEEGNDLRLLDILNFDKSDDYIFYFGIKNESDIYKYLKYCNRKNRAFITYSNKENKEHLLNLERGIKEFSKYNIIVYNSEDIEDESIYKIECAIKAFKDGYDEIIWLDHDIIPTPKIDSIWVYIDKIGNNPIMPIWPFYNFEGIEIEKIRDNSHIKDAKSNIGLNSNFNDIIYTTDVVLMNRNNIPTLNKIKNISHNENTNEFLNKTDIYLNVFKWKEDTKNLGYIFMPLGAFKKEISDKIINSSESEYINLLNGNIFKKEYKSIGLGYLSLILNNVNGLRENNYNDIILYKGTDEPYLDKLYLDKIIYYNNSFLESTKNKVNSYVSEISSTTINKYNYNLDNNIIFNCDFNNGPRLSINGENKENFKVKFYDGDLNLAYYSDLKTNMWSKLNKKYVDNWLISVEWLDNIRLFRFNPTNKNIKINIKYAELKEHIECMVAIEKFMNKRNCNICVATKHYKYFEDKYENIKFIDYNKRNKELDFFYATYNIGINMSLNESKISKYNKSYYKIALDVLNIN